MWYIYANGYHSAFKKNGIMPLGETNGMGLEIAIRMKSVRQMDI